MVADARAIHPSGTAVPRNVVIFGCVGYPPTNGTIEAQARLSRKMRWNKWCSTAIARAGDESKRWENQALC